MRSDVNAIVVGYNGKLDMYQAIGYIRLPDPTAEEIPEKLARDVFDSIW